MNKSVLPMVLDSISYDSVSLSKSKKPWVEADVSGSASASARVASASDRVASASDRRDSFAEHLSQSQRELKKDKTQDTVENKRREKTDVGNPKARVTTENVSHQKQHVKKEAVDQQQEPVSRLDASSHTEKENLKQTHNNLEVSEAEFSAETIVNSEITADATVTVHPISEVGLELFDAASDASALIVTDTAAVAETESLSGTVAQFQFETENHLPLADTNQELIAKGVDIKELGENYLQGIDIRPEQKSLAAEIVEPAEIANNLTVLSELMTANIKTVEANNTENAAINIPGIEKLIVPVTQAQINSPAMPVNKNGMELPLELVAIDTEETQDIGLDELINLTDEVKSEDKSTKTDLFKTLLVQSQTEKTSSVEKPPVVAPVMAPVTTAQVATANRLFTPQTQLGMNTAHPHWGNAVGEKIMWMANQQLSSADIRLDPPELGSLQVKVTIQQDQASITFITPHPQVRELLDQQVTRLREMFAEQGLNLGQVDIADKREHESRQSDDETKSKSRFVSEESEETQVASISSLYLVDQFV